MTTKPSFIVKDIAGNKAVVEAKDMAAENELLALGFNKRDGVFEKPVATIDDRATLVRQLIQLGAAFSAGKDWSPAEFVEYLKEQWLVTQSFMTISWKGPGQFQVR